MPKVKKRYPSDLSDAQWSLLEPYIPDCKPGGRPRRVDMRLVVEALLYMARTGVQWRYLPEKFPPRSTVFEYFSRWQKDGTLDKINDVLRCTLRSQTGRKELPSASIIDSQTVKSTEESIESSGYDGGKKNKGS